jgi:YesN/AraC family two-component response regulator
MDVGERGPRALDAFRYGVEAYLLLPATKEALRDVINSLKTKSSPKNIHAEGVDSSEK